MVDFFNKLFKSTWRVFGLFTVLAVIGIFVVSIKLKTPTTNDARVMSNVIPIASTVNGVIANVLIKDNQFVKQGQSLFELNSNEMRMQITRARARLNSLKKKVVSLETQLATSKDEYQLKQREFEQVSSEHQANKILFDQNKLSETDLEKSQAWYKASQTQLNQADHTVKQIQARLVQTKAMFKEAKIAYDSTNNQINQLLVKAPTDGYISNLNLQNGTAVKAYHPLFGIIQPTPVWVIANFLETELVKIRPGQKAKVNVMLYPSQSFEGEVESIGYGIAPDEGQQFNNVLPKVSPEYSWVRLAQRFPVRIRITHPKSDFPLRIGANARVKVYTKR